MLRPRRSGLPDGCRRVVVSPSFPVPVPQPALNRSDRASSQQVRSQTPNVLDDCRPGVFGSTTVALMATGNVPIGVSPFRVVPPPPEIDPKALRDAEHLKALRAKHTLAEIGRLTGMAHGTVEAWSRRHGLTKPPIRRRPRDAEWLRARYIDDGMTAAEIADLIGGTESGVRKSLGRLGIRKRPSRTATSCS